MNTPEPTAARRCDRPVLSDRDTSAASGEGNEPGRAVTAACEHESRD